MVRTLSTIVIVVGALMTVILFALALDPFAYCYSVGVNHVTATLSNGNTTTYTLIGTPVCGIPHDFVIPYFALLALGVILIVLGVIARRRAR